MKLTVASLLLSPVFASKVPICANLNITSSYTCVSYCNDNGYGNGTASWDIQGNINGTDTSCVCYSTEGLTETVCTTAGNVPVMAPAPVGSIPSCITLNITSSDECNHACYPEGGLITGVSFSNGFCQCVGVFNNMPSFILCEDATPTASPTSDADVTSSLIAGCFALFATIMHIL